MSALWSSGGYVARRAAQKERVRILYRRALKDTLNWAVHRHLFYQDEDPDTIDRLIADGEASYNKWRHPDPYIVPWAPGGRMDEKEDVTVKKIDQDVTIFRLTPIRIAVSLLSVFLLFCIIRLGFQVATGVEPESSRKNWGFRIGVVTLIVGVLFVALGLPILINLFLKMSEQLQRHEVSGIYTVSLSLCNNEADGEEMKPLRTIIIRILVTLMTMFMLAWASYTGYRLTTEPRRDDKYYPLIFPIGIVTIVFGAVYIIIGLAIIADLSLSLTVKLMLRRKKGSIVHEDNTTETKISV
ncbi:hypothetical protein G4B88_021945 [Cannabis sativa]|uniref:NADH dehydrogenase [ubiquinone] 1 beta subcomplex subunit 9 n=1 Tax=Cannabis sativa TaxID=3483 RepID=A0A7J6FZV6_CANSA|nr:hypothetical protein G4B88_021945 [Cannabis sativa]